MKRNGISAIILSVLIIMMGACNDSVWSELPAPISQFITKYFPQSDVASYNVDGAGNCTATIKNGATLTFNGDYAWIDVNGNGSPLPSMFIYDELPPILYNYVDEMEQTDAVYRVTRTDQTERVDFLNTYVIYEIATGKITYPSVEE